MKKRFLLGAVVLFVLIHSFWPAYTPQYPTVGTNVVVFGDSLAEGYGAGNGNDIASRLSVSLGQKVINLGVAGDQTADALARIDTLLQSDPRVVIILLGGNDAIHQVPATETFANLEQIVSKITTSGAGVVLVGEPGGLYGSQYETKYEELAEKYQTFYIPNILSGLIGHPEYMSDYIHPNAAGYAIAAERILPVVQDALSGGN